MCAYMYYISNNKSPPKIMTSFDNREIEKVFFAIVVSGLFIKCILIYPVLIYFCFVTMLKGQH